MGLSALAWQWQAVRQSKTTERKYSLFPWHHPARNGGESKKKRGHSWWQPHYHLLLTNSLCFTYKLAHLRTRRVALWSQSEQYYTAKFWCIFLCKWFKILHIYVLFLQPWKWEGKDQEWVSLLKYYLLTYYFIWVTFNNSCTSAVNMCSAITMFLATAVQLSWCYMHKTVSWTSVIKN